MNLRKVLFLLCLWLIPLALSAQRTISGRITDADDGAPILGAAVFIANTTIGTTTNADGYYQLTIQEEGSYQLAISHVAYLPVFRELDQGKASIVIDVALQTRELEGVEVSVKIKVRNKDKELFWDKILGTKPSKKNIWVLNPDDIYFFYNSETEKLTVSCRVPIQIINYETGYFIQYVLKNFTHDYKTNTSSWEGKPIFRELEPENFRQKQLWEKNRKNIYQVSISNFIKSLYHNTLLENGFLLTKGRKSSNNVIYWYYLANTTQFLTSNSTDAKLLKPVNDLILFCYGKPIDSNEELRLVNSPRLLETIGKYRLQIEIPDEQVHIFPDGTYTNTLQMSPYALSKSLMGLNMMLPIDYLSDTHPVTTGGFVENEPDDKIATDTSLPEHPLEAPLMGLTKRFDLQLNVFPQEKVHLHTDKPYYISGERIWFRAHVVDAASHTPSFMAKSVFVELFDARDSVVCRVKTGIENNLFSGHLSIPEDVPEGDYTIRAYTGTIRNLDEDYFFMKNIRIGDPMSRIIQVQPEFEFMSDKKIEAVIRFSSPLISHPSPLNPDALKISINSGKLMNVKSENGVSGITFNLPSTEKQRVLLLDAKCNQKPYRKYIKIPLPDDDFDVSFYPEGGYSLYGSIGKIAFKAMQRDGKEIDITGIVYDQKDNELIDFKTDLFGMGQFMMSPKQGETYYAICTNSKGQSKRFDLPAAKNEGYVLSATWVKDQLIVKTLCPEHQTFGGAFCLMVHTRGIVQDVRIWENINEPVSFQKDFFPSGVTNLLLLNKEMQPVSERLMFVNNGDQANVTCSMDKDNYSVRSPVEYTVNITDETGESVRGNISVSVTDDHEVAVDSTSNILTSLLLTSDLRGNISNPAFYFQNNRQATYMLDLLMLTQGWRRYDTERIVRNELMYPDTLLGKGYEISGTVKVFGSSRPEANANVSLLARKRTSSDSIVTKSKGRIFQIYPDIQSNKGYENRGTFSGSAVTDSNGRFYLHDGEAPDSFVFVVQAESESNRRRLELTLDKPAYPARTIPVAYSEPPKPDIFSKYAEKAEQKYTDEYGTRMVYLSEIAITAPKKPIHKTDLYNNVNFSFTEDDLDNLRPSSMISLLGRIPGITYKRDSLGLRVIVTGAMNNNYEYECYAMLLVDGFQVDHLDGVDVYDVAQIDFVKDIGSLFFLGDRALCGIISIFTKRGIPKDRKETPYIKYMMPLGFQKPAEFYAPKYDKPSLNTKPDLRTTIYWEPNLTTDEDGKANFRFYTADVPTTYTVVIEGITEDGKIVYKRDKIVVKK